MAGGSLGKLNVLLGLDSAEFTSGLTKAERQSKSSLGNIAASAQAAISAIGGIGVILSGVSGAALTVLVTRTVDAMDEMSKLAQSTGTTVESISSLGFAADLAGLSTQQLGDALSRLTKGMSDSQMGTGEADKAFKAMGITVTGANGQLKKSDEVLSEVADKFSQYADGANKTALAISIFGRAGAQLIPLLNGGAQGIQELREESDKLGITLSTVSAQQAEAFNDNISRMKAEFEGAANQITVEVLPAIKSYTDFTIDALTETGSLAGAVHSLAEYTGLKDFLTDMGNMAAATADEFAALARIANVFIANTKSALAIGKSLLAESAVDHTGIVGFFNKDAADKQTADLKSVYKEQADAIAAGNKAIDDALNPDKYHYRHLMGLASANTGGAGDVDLSNPIGQLAPILVKPTTGSGKGKAAKTNRDIVYSSLDQYFDVNGLNDNIQGLGVTTKDTFDDMGEFAKQASRNIENSLGDGLYDLITGKFDGIGAKFAQTLARMASDAAAVNIGKLLFGDVDKTGNLGGLAGSALAGIFGGGPSTGNFSGSSLSGVNWSPAVAFAGGGQVPGQGKGDTVPAWLTPGEFVMNRQAVNRLGIAQLNAANKYASGGLVGAGGSGAQGDAPINIINQTQGRVDSATMTTLPDGERAILLQQAVEATSRAMYDANSSVSKALARNTNAQRSR